MPPRSTEALLTLAWEDINGVDGDGRVTVDIGHRLDKKSHRVAGRKAGDPYTIRSRSWRPLRPEAAPPGGARSGAHIGPGHGRAQAEVNRHC